MKRDETIEMAIDSTRPAAPEPSKGPWSDLTDDELDTATGGSPESDDWGECLNS